MMDQNTNAFDFAETWHSGIFEVSDYIVEYRQSPISRSYEY